MSPEEILTEEEKRAIRKTVRRRSIEITRWVSAFVILAIICLSWYGAEMLIYGYSQPSVVKAFVAVCIAIGVSGSIKKEMIKNDNKKDFLEGFAQAIKDGRKDNGGNG